MINQQSSGQEKKEIELIEKQGSYENVLTSINLEPDEPDKFSFLEEEDYTLKAIVTDDILIAKF